MFANKETAKKEIEKLIKKYELLLQEGRIHQYQEANTRKDFILPLFAALGWEIDSIDEVDEETAVSRGRVDYSFKLSGVARFYLEAKALKIDLDKQEYAEQAIDYAYNKGVPWAVLTDFEKIKLFNAEWKAKTLTDSQFFELAYDEYLNKFDQLWLLSKEAISQGLLDKEAERWGKKDKKQPISKQILADLLKAREKLTKNILQHSRLNKISEEELDEAVQRILDRLIFIRTCEDRNIEQNRLLSAVRLWREKRINLWENLKKIFRDFDDGYNSKLFEEHLCENLTIDDEILAEIVQDLYQTPDGSRYDFSAISADVLGNIYEQYLGHILKKTSKSARLKETYQHRKKMGIYYTPTYIVDYIVKNTLGEILETAKPKAARKLRILDPACGSGSFLIRAFDELVNYWVEQNKKQSEFGAVQKTEILSNNIYGVDLDKQAVEITQMNLLLKTLYVRERLPMLKNIRNGNSLIDDPKIAAEKAFKWEEEFKEVISEGGFDVVIGNPPYVRPHNIPIKDKEFFWTKYKTFKAKADLYNCFIEKGINLTKKKGLFSFIVPHTWTSLESFFEIRKYIMENCRIIKLVQLPQKVFQEAAVETTIFVLQKEKNKNRRNNNKIIVEALDEIGKLNFIKKFSQKQILSNHLYNFELYTDITANTLLNKIKSKGKPLELLINFFYGLKTGDDEKFITREKKNDNYKMLLRSKDIGRYFKSFKKEYIWYVPEKMIENKSTARPGDKQRFENEKIIVARMGKKVEATYDNENFYIKDGMLLLKKLVKNDLRYITGLLNSKLINFYYRNYFITIDVLKNALLNLPIAESDENTKKEFIGYVDKMLKLNKQLQALGGKLTDERKKIESEIQKTDKEIDELVYKLYDLTEEEIKIVEGK